jgi:heme a synthase
VRGPNPREISALSSRSFAIAALLARVTAVAMFGLIVLGSVVRTTGSGLACPDWPLCEGRLIPRFQLNVMLEWSHRTVALVVSLGLFATTAWIVAHRDTRRRLGGLAALAVALLFVQILLGALTVWKLLSPAVVSSHLATALLLFASVVLLGEVAAESARDAESPPAPRTGVPGLAIACGLVAALAWAQSVMGGVVSTSHAGTVCPDWPGCRGELFPPLTGLVGLQMIHRYAAYGLLAAVLALALAARRAPEPFVRGGTSLALTLTTAQAVFGILNVLLATPIWLSALHLGTATLLLTVLVTTTFRARRAAAMAPAPLPRLAAETA